MKWIFVLLLGTTVLFLNACEMHPASELPEEEGAQTEATSPGKEKAEHGQPEKLPSAANDHGQSPKYFPDPEKK